MAPKKMFMLLAEPKESASDLADQIRNSALASAKLESMHTPESLGIVPVMSEKGKGRGVYKANLEARIAKLQAEIDRLKAAK